MTDLSDAFQDAARSMPMLGDADAALLSARRHKARGRVTAVAGAALLAVAGSTLAVTSPWQSGPSASAPATHGAPHPPNGGWAITPSYLNKCKEARWRGCLSITGSVYPPGEVKRFESIVRPLTLPRVSAGQACPVDPSHRVDNAVLGGSAVGEGPVQLLIADRLRYPGTPQGKWDGFKAVWFVAKRYSGPVLVRGERLDGPGRPAFTADAVFRSLASPGAPPAVAHQVRFWPDSLYVRAAGCYGFQVDGRGFSYDIVIQVRPT